MNAAADFPHFYFKDKQGKMAAIKTLFKRRFHDTRTHMTPSNIIFTGVAGTGKTYRLQQIAKDYTDIRPLVTPDELLATLIEPLSWREVICLVFLDERQKGKTLLKVPEILQNLIFSVKVAQNNRTENLSNTAWSTLMTFSSPNSTTINYSKRASQAYFDKDESSNWFLLPDSLPLLTNLQQKLSDYHTAIAPENRHNNVLKTERFSLVSFHQAYGYEEFVEGIRPQVMDNGQMNYAIKAGAFITLCEQAKKNPQYRYAMLIDEINRANVARVFGELMSLIEPSKRAGQVAEMSVNLAYSGQSFSVPSNVDIYATMNTQDHSLAPLDMAFRRRFNFIECLPDSSILGQMVVGDEVIDLANLLTALNEKIRQTLGKDSELGHSFLITVKSLDELALAFEQAILPQIAHACQNNGQILQAIFGEKVIVLAQKVTNRNGFSAMNGAFYINKASLLEPKTYHDLYAFSNLG